MRALQLRAFCLTAITLAAAAGARAAIEIPVELDEHRAPATVTTGDCLIRGGTVLTGTKGVIQNGSVLIRGGKIEAVGKDLTAPAGVPVIDAAGKWITPGIIDAHTHIASDSINESADSITAEVRIHDVLNPEAIAIYRALAGGVTAALVLHGSANTIGGQSAVVKMKWKRPVEEMLVPDAPRIIKFALGENPKRSNSRSDAVRFPVTRMGVEAVLRRGFEEARRYRLQWDRYERERKADPDAVPPRRDLRLETLADILDGKIWVHCHAYRADEMLMVTRLSKEFGFRVAAFQHALEAYRIAPELAEAKIGVSTFLDNWAYKVEAYEAIPYTAALCREAGIITSVNSDDAERMRRLNLDASKSIRYGDLSPEEALKLVTLYPAQQLGIAHRTGSLEPGKDGDVAIWEGHTLSVYSRCAMTLVEGRVFFQRRDAFGLNGVAATEPELKECRADHLGIPTPALSRAYALVGGTVHPVSGPAIPDGMVVLENGRIAAVGRSLTLPKGTITVNVRGLHVYPGLIDAGSQLGLQEISSVPATLDVTEGGEFQPDLTAMTAVNAASEHIAVTRCDGVTAAVARPSGSLVAGQSALINLDGWTPDQMSVQDRLALHVRFPETTLFTSGLSGESTATPAAAGRMERLRELFTRAKHYADATAKQADSLPYDPRLQAMVPYVTGKAPVVFDVNTARGVRDAVRFAEQLGLKPIIYGGREAWRVADLLAQKQVPVIYTHVYALPANSYDPYDVSYAAPGVLARAGVKVAFASDSAALAKELPRQVGMACAFGLSKDAGLRAVTLGAAEILGVADRMGSLESGKLGNVIVTDGDPLEPSVHLHYLFINGKPVPLESKHTRLYQHYRQRLTNGNSTAAPR